MQVNFALLQRILKALVTLTNMDNNQAVHQETLITDTIVVTAKNTNFVYECQQYPSHCQTKKELDSTDFIAIGICIIIAVAVVWKLRKK